MPSSYRSACRTASTRVERPVAPVQPALAVEHAAVVRVVAVEEAGDVTALEGHPQAQGTGIGRFDLDATDGSVRAHRGTNPPRVITARVPLLDGLPLAVDRQVALGPGHLGIAEDVVEQPSVPHLLVSRLEERRRARPQCDVERQAELRIVEQQALRRHRLHDLEPERTDGERVGARPERPREADVTLLAPGDDAGVTVHHIGVRMEAEPAEDMHAGPIEGEVVAVVEVTVRGRRDVDRRGGLVEREVVERIQLH